MNGQHPVSDLHTMSIPRYLGMALTDSVITDIELFLGVVIVLCFFFFFIIRRPVVGLVSFMFLVLTRAHEYIPDYQIFRPSVGVGLFMLVGLFIHLLINRKPLYFTGPQSLILFVFVAYCWISLFTEGQTLYDLNGRFLIEPMLLVSVSFFVTINAVRSMSDLWIVERSLILIGVAISSLALVQSFVTGNFLHLGRSWSYESESAIVTRVGSLGVDPNGLAITLAVLLPLCYYLLNNEKRSVFMKRCYQSSIPLFVLTIFLTYSRTGFVCLIAALFLTFNKKLSVKNVIGFGSLLIIVVFVIPWTFWERMASTATTDTTGSGRLFIYQAALNMIQAHPLTGVGHGQFYYLYDQYGGQLWHLASSQNTYLTIAAETGLINLLIFLSLLLVTLFDLRRLKREALHSSFPSTAQLSDALEASLGVALLAGLTIDCSSWVPFYIFMALVVALKRIWQPTRETVAIQATKEVVNAKRYVSLDG